MSLIEVPRVDDTGDASLHEPFVSLATPATSLDPLTSGPAAVHESLVQLIDHSPWID